MEHLSAEERACLMYLEETIEALEVQEDSGLSNDEAEPVSLEDKLRQMRVEGRHVFMLLDSAHINNHNCVSTETFFTLSCDQFGAWQRRRQR